MEKNKIYNESNILTMYRMIDGTVDGVITSPPYNYCNKRKDTYYDNGYSQLDGLPENEYLDIRIAEFKEFSRILNDKGVICYNISYHNENPILPTLLMTRIHQETDLTLADMITWRKSTALPFQTSPTKLSRICEQIYVIVKKDHLHNFKTNKKISKVNEKTGQKFYKNYVNLVEAKNNDGIKTKLKATYSEDLVIKLLNIYFPEDSLIYDPFSGIGTTAKACQKFNRRYIGSELNEEYYNTSLKRLKNNDLKYENISE